MDRKTPRWAGSRVQEQMREGDMGNPCLEGVSDGEERAWGAGGQLAQDRSQNRRFQDTIQHAFAERSSSFLRSFKYFAH